MAALHALPRAALSVPAPEPDDHPPAVAPVPDSSRRLLTVREAAAQAGCHENTLRRWIRSGDDEQLDRAVIQLPGGHIRIRRAAFLHWLDHRDTGAQE